MSESGGRLLVLNGPNLARLGSREPEVYGRVTHDELVAICTGAADKRGWSADVRQTDDEATYLGWLHEAADAADLVGAILNPAAWTHTSVAIRDAAANLGVPFVEVHLSNPLAREEFRHRSLTAGLATGLVAGFGADSYVLAIDGLASQVERDAGSRP